MANEKPEKIDLEDLNKILSAKTNVKTAALVAEKAASEAEIAHLNYRMAIQQIYIKYGLTFTDAINENDGAITDTTQQNEELTTTEEKAENESN